MASVVTGTTIAQDEPRAGRRAAPDSVAEPTSQDAAERRREMHERRRRRVDAEHDRPAEQMLVNVLLRNDRAAERLGISEEQVESIRTQVAEQREAYQKLARRLKDCAVEQAHLVSHEPVDEAALMQAIDNCFAIRSELAKIKIRQILLVRQVLTPEQLAEARRMLEEHQRKRREKIRRPRMMQDDQPERPKRRLEESPDEQPGQREQFDRPFRSGDDQL